MKIHRFAALIWGCRRAAIPRSRHGRGLASPHSPIRTKINALVFSAAKRSNLYRAVALNLDCLISVPLKATDSTHFGGDSGAQVKGKCGHRRGCA
jgi:hypothetical protein